MPSAPCCPQLHHAALASGARSRVEASRGLGFSAFSGQRRHARPGACPPGKARTAPPRLVAAASGRAGADPWDGDPFESLSRVHEQMERMDRQMDAEMRGMQQRVQQINEEAARQAERAEQLAREGRSGVQQLNGPGLHGFRWESSSSSASARSYQSVVIVQGRPFVDYGPPPAAAFTLQSALLGLALLAATAYAALAAAFTKGYHATKYTESPRRRLPLILLWPFFYAFSDSFRGEFRQALKARSAPPPSQADRPDGGEPGSSAST